MLVMSWTDQFDAPKCTWSAYPLVAIGYEIFSLEAHQTRPCLMLDSYKLVAQVGQMLLNS